MLKLLDPDKININWNKKPIKMNDFLKFLTVDTSKSTSHLGHDNGWTERVNKDIMLIIGGGIINGIEYLDSLKYGKRMRCDCNDFVNPFYMFDIMTTEGKKFFYNYYKNDIKELIQDQQRLVDNLTLKKSKEGLKLSQYRVFEGNIKNELGSEK